MYVDIVVLCPMNSDRIYNCLIHTYNALSITDFKQEQKLLSFVRKCRICMKDIPSCLFRIVMRPYNVLLRMGEGFYDWSTPTCESM